MSIVAYRKRIGRRRKAIRYDDGTEETAGYER